MPASTVAEGAAAAGAPASECDAFRPGPLSPSPSFPPPARRRPCPHQVAGHLTPAGEATALIDDAGRFYKPLQAGPRGARERAFYEAVTPAQASSSSSPSPAASFAARHAPFLAALPRYHGVMTEAAAAGGSDGAPTPTSFLVLEDLAASYARPCAADLKVGRRTWYAGAGGADVAKWRAKDDATTQAALGWKVCGMRAWRKGGEGGGGGGDCSAVHRWWRPAKAWCKALTPAAARDALVTFAGDHPAAVYGGPRGAAAQAAALAAWAATQTDFALHSASVLLLYEGDARASAATGARPAVRLVDFAHSFVTTAPGGGGGGDGGGTTAPTHPATPHPSLVGVVDRNLADGLAALAAAFGEAAGRPPVEG